MSSDRPADPIAGVVLPALEDATRIVEVGVEQARVVVVDDEPANVRLLERLLQSLGVAEVHGVTDSQQAVRCCFEVHADLVLLDLIMPRPDGFEVMAELRDTLSADAFLPVLVLTADVARSTRDRALQAGASDFLTKPLDHAEVALRARNLLGTRALYTRVQQHNETLRAELQQRRDGEARAAEHRRGKAARIRRILDEGLVFPVFQPIVDLRSGRLLGAEALARFDTEPAHPPNEWFAEAAEVGLGTELDLAAVRAALACLDDLPADTFLSVNVAPSTASDPALHRLIDEVPGNRLVIELTEHTRIDDYAALSDALDALRARNARIAVDDAGAGYAGLQHVLSLRPDVLKLDRALIRGIDTDPARRALATGMVAFAAELDATLIAEGIETQAELETLQTLQITHGQGFYLAHPGPVSQVGCETILRT